MTDKQLEARTSMKELHGHVDRRDKLDRVSHRLDPGEYCLT